MSLERTTHLLVGVLLAVAFLTVSSAAVAGASAAELEQSTNETAANATTNDSTANATLDNLTVWTAPGDDFANLTSPAAVQAAKREGWLTRSRTVAEDDTVVFGLPAPGLVEAVTEANDTESDAAAFLAVLGRSDTDEFRMELTTGMGRKELDLSATLAADGLRVVPDERSGTLYVALRTERAVLDYGGDRERSFEDGEDYRVNLTHTSGNATTSSEVEWGIVERRLAFEESGEPVVVRLGQPCTVVSGETAAAPGTDIEVRLRSPETHRIQATTRTTVGPSGEFATCIDTTGVDRDTTFHLGAATFNDDYDHPVHHSSSAPPATPDGDPAVWIAPTERFGDHTSLAAVQTAKRDDWLTRTRTVAEGDTVVFGLPEPGLVEAVTAANTSGPDSAAFVTVLNRSDTYDFRMEQTDDTTTTMAAPKELNLSATVAADALRVVPNERTGMLYVALRTDRAVLGRGNGYPLPFEDGEDYRVNLTVTDGNVTTSSTVEWSLVSRWIDFDGEIEPEDGITDPHVTRLGQRCTVVSGETSLAPGTNIPLELRSNESGPVRASARPTVEPSGEFATCVDTTGFDRNATLVLGAAGFDDDYNETVVDRQFEPAADAAGIRSVWTAPTERFGGLTSPAAVGDGKQYGWLTRNRTVAVNDTVVFAVRAPELTTQIELSRGNASATERFVELVNRSSVYHFRMEQTEDTTLTELDEKELNLSMTLARGATRVVPDEHNGTLYVALRTDLVALDFGSLRGEPPAGGEDYRVNVTVGTGPTANTSAVRVSAVDRTVTFDDEWSAGIVVDDLGQQCTRLSGRTSVAPGTSVRVDLRSRNGTVRTTHATTVNRSGRFSVCADTTGIPDDAVLDLRIDEAPDFEGVLIENRTGLLDVSVRAVTDDEIEIGGIFRNTTGFVALYAAPEAATALTDPARPPNCAQSAINRTVANWTHLAVGDFDWSGYGYAELDRPSIADDRALIAVAHRNRDGKFDFEAPTTDPPVCRDGALVGTVVNLQGPPSANDTEGSDRTTVPPTTVIADPPVDGSPTANVPTTTADGPGFGFAAAALALLTVALLARRRH